MNRLPEIFGVILAAGEASRMGRAKQLLPFKGKTILEWVIDNALASSLHGVVVVIGHQADLIEPVIAGKDVTVVVNADYKSGQSSSIKAGLGALPEGADAVLFLLGDQPLVAPETINRIIDVYRSSPGSIVLPVCNGKRGNPVLFSRETFPRLASLDGDRGARQLFEENADTIQQVQVDDPNIHFDVDTEEDYQHLLDLGAVNK